MPRFSSLIVPRLIKLHIPSIEVYNVNYAMGGAVLENKENVHVIASDMRCLIHSQGYNRHVPQ